MRYLDLQTVSADASQAVYHAVAEASTATDAATLITVSPDRPYVCVGYHQAATREIDREYCEREGIPVGRRRVGGGAVYLDHDQIFWHLILPGLQTAVEELYARFLVAPVRTYRWFGIEAWHRPVNDLLVGSRKIGGTGAGTIGAATVLVGSILMDFDSRAMARVLRVPSEKFRDKMVDGLKDYMTTVRRELGAGAPARDEITRVLVEEFARVLGEDVVSGELSDGERQALERDRRLLFDSAFVYRSEGWIKPGVKIRDGVRLLEGVHKAAGGLVRLIVRECDGRVDDALVSGDFFVDPPDGLATLGSTLVGRPATRDVFARVVADALAGVTIPGVTLDDFLSAFDAAHGQAQAPESARGVAPMP